MQDHPAQASEDLDDYNAIERNNNRKLTADKIRQILSEVGEDKSGSARRWVWELIQNAKDVPHKKFGRVRIQISLQEDQLEFKHNGDPFTMKNIMALIQQVSSKDSSSSNEEVTGKFGTGFIATHLLSEVIDVVGVVLHKGVHRRFCTTLDRAGTTSEELIPKIGAALDHIREIENNEKFAVIAGYEHQRTEDSLDTAFIYPLQSEGSKKAAHEGLADLMYTLPQTLIFNPGVEEVKIDDQVKGVVRTFSCRKIADEGKVCSYQIQIDVEDKAPTFKRYFIYQEGALQLAAEVDDFEQPKLIGHHGKQPTLFRDFPLIGSEKFHFPFMLNGRKLYPTQQRNGLKLHADTDSEAIYNRAAIEQAIQAAIDFTIWLLDHNAQNRYVCAITRLPEEKNWDEFSKPWYTALQKDWRSRLRSLPIVESAEGIPAVLGECVIPLHGRDHETREAFFELCLPIFGKKRLPQLDQLHAWIKVVEPEEERGTWGEKLTCDLEELVEQLSSKANLDQLAKESFATVDEAVAWINRLYNFIINQKETELFSDYSIIPNLAGEFTSLEDLKIESKQDPIPDEFMAILHRIDPAQDWRTQIIYRDIEFPNQNIEQASLGDLSQEVKRILEQEERNTHGQHEKKFVKRTDSLEILIEILRYHPTGATLQDKRARLFQKGKEIWLFEADLKHLARLATNETSFNFLPALRLFVELLNLEISKYETLEAISDHLGLEDWQAVKWFNDYLKDLTSGDELAGREKVGNFVPSRAGTLVAFEDMHRYGTEDVPLNDELIDILARLDYGQNWRAYLPYEGLSFRFPQVKKFEELGDAVMNRFEEIYFKERSSDSSVLATWEDELLDLIGWCNRNEELANRYLGKFRKEEKTLYFELTVKGQNIGLDTLKLLKDQEAVQMLTKIQASGISSEKLEELLDIAAELGDVDTLVSQAKKLQEEHRNFNYLLGIGTDVEKAFKKALEDVGIESEIKHQGVGAFDLIISNPTNGKSYQIELKSFSAQSDYAFRFAPSQAAVVVQNPPNYAIGLLPRPNQQVPIDIAYLRQHFRFRKQVESLFRDGYGDWQQYQAMQQSEKPSRLHIVLLEKERIEIQRSTLLNQAQGFDELVMDIQAVLR